MSETDTSNNEPELTGMDKVLHELKELAQTILVFAPIYLLVTTFGYELRSIPSESMVPTLQVGDRVAVSKFAYGYSKYSVSLDLGKYLPIPEGRIMANMPKRGDVVVFRHTHLDRVMIKRLIGLPGDELQIVNGRVTLNGTRLPQEALRRVQYAEFRPSLGGRRMLEALESEETMPSGVSYLVHDIEGRSNGESSNITFKVPEGHFFFVGDNRDNSTDARALIGHCVETEDNVVDRAGCAPRSSRVEPSIGYVPFDNLIGRADTVFFTLNFCDRYESGCNKNRVWRGL